MNIAKFARLLFSGNGPWAELRRYNLSIPFLAWGVLMGVVWAF